MISRHQYINGTLYLYFDYSYEFGNFNIKKTKNGYIDTIKDYIKKIGFKGSKIVIVVGSIVVLTLSIRGNNIALDSKENLDNNIVISETIKESEVLDSSKIEEPIVEDVVIEEPSIEKQKIEKNTIKESTQSIQTEKKESNNTKQTTNNTTPSSLTTSKTITTSNTQTKNEENLISLVHNGETIKIELEEYVVGVVAAEMPAAFNIEALKAQSVIARTYALNLLSKGRTLTDNNSTQSYIDVNQMKSKWGNDYNKYYTKITEAVKATKGVTVKYNGEYIDAVYHSTSNGYTEDSVNVWGNSIPYLKSVESSSDKNATTYLRTQNIDLSIFNNKLGTSISSNDEIEIISYTDSNRVKEVKVQDKTYSGVEFRNILGLRSADFDIDINDNNVVITTRGYGHGVGMSQYGANGMASEGYTYKQILNHYYTNVIVN